MRNKNQNNKLSKHSSRGSLKRTAARASGISLIALAVAAYASGVFDSGPNDPGETNGDVSADRSLFESGFWLQGTAQSESEELRPVFALLMDETNPRTGENYTEAEAKKAQYLARLFPENELIPRPDLIGYRESREERARRHEADGYSIVGGETSPAEIESYYAHLSKQYTDQNELLEYALQYEEVPAEYGSRMEKMLATGRQVLAEIAEQKQRSLNVYEARLAEGVR